jgi:lysylphosphatidylglycerol synthetase-like protein (DUF2156 family)
MYCRKCGRKIDYDSELCYECLNDEMIFGTDDPERKKNSDGSVRRTLGLTKGIIAMVLSYIALIFSYVALSLQTTLNLYVSKIWITIILVLAFGALIVPIVFIIQNFGLYRKVKKEHGVKLIPMFVLNFTSIGTMALMFFCSLITVVLLIVF